jgi:hypothetical protein
MRQHLVGLAALLALATAPAAAQDSAAKNSAKDAAGAFTLKTVATALKDHQDRYHGQCPMKW